MRRSNAIQPALPGFGGVKSARRRPSHVRVRSDPDVVAAERVSQDRFEDWRRSFTSFVGRLPEERRQELRDRIAGLRGRGQRVIRSREVDAA